MKKKIPRIINQPYNHNNEKKKREKRDLNQQFLII